MSSESFRPRHPPSIMQHHHDSPVHPPPSTVANVANDSVHHTRAETPFRAFLNSQLPREQLRDQARPLLSSENILQAIEEMAPEDQGRFIDKVNQARRPDYRRSPAVPFDTGSRRCT